MDLRQRATDLGPQLDAVDRRELTEEAGPDIDFAPQGLADGYDRGGRRRRRGLVSAMGRKAEPGEEEAKRDRDAERRHFPSPPARPRRRFVQPLSFKLRRVGDLIHETIRESLPYCPGFDCGTARAVSGGRSGVSRRWCQVVVIGWKSRARG